MNTERKESNFISLVGPKCIAPLTAFYSDYGHAVSCLKTQTRGERAGEIAKSYLKGFNQDGKPVFTFNPKHAFKASTAHALDLGLYLSAIDGGRIFRVGAV